MKLSEALLNKKYIIEDNYLSNIERRRILDLGFTQNSIVIPLYKGIFNNPTAFLIKGSIIALRDDISNKIIVGEKCEKKDCTSRKPKRW